MRRRAALVVVVVGLIVGLAGVPAEAAASTNGKTAKVGLKRFNSCGQIVRFGEKHALDELDNESGTRGVLDQEQAPGGSVQPEAKQKQPQSGPQEVAQQPDGTPFSKTNNQEEGVDEPDLAKSDGRTIFTFAGGYLYAVDARAERPRVIGSVKVGDPREHELLLDGDRALVISHDPGAERTRLAEVDVSDPSRMRITRTLRSPGEYISARMTGHTARIVLSTPPRAEDFEREAAVKKSRLRDWVPYAAVADRETGERTKQRLVSCRAIRRPAQYSGLGMLTVLTVDMEQGLPLVDADAVFSEGGTVYASTKNLYVATERYDEEDGDAGVTTIHKLRASEPGETSYRASGDVLGSLLSQFSLSEHEGKLRAATTHYGERDQESYVTVLAEHARKLVRIGRAARLGEGHSIESVRFVGEAGFVTTFRRTDPLYTLDLSKPRRPTVLGELRIFGYSAYLHPLDDGLLLSVGLDATPDGSTLGTQLSLYDVSDLGSPRRLARHTLSRDTGSEVEFDHRAFLHWPPTGLAVLPVSDYGDNPSSSALGFEIGRSSGIRKVGTIFHRVAPAKTYPINRSLVVGDRLFTFSGQGFDSRDVETFGSSAFVPFAKPDPEDEGF